MTDSEAGPDEDGAVVREFNIINRRGLHARASARFVETVRAFDADIRVEKDGVSVGGTSIMGLMMLAATPGCVIRVSATGPQSDDVMQALETLIGSRFGEDS